MTPLKGRFLFIELSENNVITEGNDGLNYKYWTQVVINNMIPLMISSTIITKPGK